MLKVEWRTRVTFVTIARHSIMSPRNGKLVQYGKRPSTKHQQPHSSSSSMEPAPKRRKLMEEDEEDELSLKYPQPQRSDLIATDNSGTPKTDTKQLHSTSLASESHYLADSPHRTPSRIYTSKSRTGGDFHFSSLGLCHFRLTSGLVDSTVLIPTRSNTPTRSSGPGTPNSHMVTNPSQPKDLSGIFAPLPQSTPRVFHSPVKSIAKRMLVRSRTEPSVSPSSPRSSPRSAIKASSSFPSVISTFPQHRQNPPSPPSPSPAISNSQLRTYSQSRSFLVALPSAMAAKELPSVNTQLDVDHSILEPDDGVRESYTDLRTRWGVDHSEVRLRHVWYRSCAYLRV